MSNTRYTPDRNTPVAILFENGWGSTIEIAEFLGISRATVVKWDREDVWQFWALDKLGFHLTYGEEQKPLDEVRTLRDKLNTLLDEHTEDDEL